MLRIGSLTLRAVPAPFGEMIRFRPVAVEGVVDAYGDVELPLELTLQGPHTPPTPIRLRLTTGTVTVFLSGGQQLAATGDPLTELGSLRLVAVELLDELGTPDVPLQVALSLELSAGP